jgi:membrane-bound serine protease (ClpP class)
VAQAIPIVEILLVILGVALLVLELKTPGSFIFVGLAAVCFLLFFWAQAALGAPLIGLGLVLFLLGLVLVGLELIVLPHHVVPGVIGLVLILAGLVVAGLDAAPETADDWGGVAVKVLRTGLVMAVGCALALAAARHVRELPFANRLVLDPPEERADADAESDDGATGLLGQTGVTLSLLGFAGMARIGERRVDVVTEGEAIPPGVAVKVVEVDGNRVVVRRA